MFKPELLSPAGTLKNMRYAFAYGADTVYAGLPRYSLRVRNNEFNYENLQIGIDEAHKLGKKFYVAMNIAPHNTKLKTFIHDLVKIVNLKPDALIISDPGLIMLVRESFPKFPIHLSVQANTVNWAAAKFWKKIGLTRVILSRELSLEEIAEIRDQVPDLEIEVFVHGALCMAYSGRCLLSNYINKRDSNQGTCTNACRWQYNIKEDKENDTQKNYHKKTLTLLQNERSIFNQQNISTNQVFLIQPKKYPKEYITAFEDEHGSYLLNSKDLCAIAYIDKLMQLGVNSLKIEGRTKSFYYCARTAQVYRQAIENAANKKPFDPSLLKMLEGLANRGYTEGFLKRHAHSDYQNYDFGYSVSKYQQFVGVFTNDRKDSLAAVEVKNKFLVGDNLELMTPDFQENFILEYMENNKGEKILVAPGDGYIVWLLIPENIKLKYALLIRNLSEKTTLNSDM